MAIFIGCAGWNLREEFVECFPSTGTHLARYASLLNAVEINSSFYRSHRASSYERWAASTPNHFCFSVKLPKQITHVNRLVDVRMLIEQFRLGTASLGNKLGPVLVQLPPSLAFDPSICESFLDDLRAQMSGPIVCEPRHPSWFEREADSLMRAYAIGRVAADPSVVPQASEPGGCQSVCYFRWHGSPDMYYSAYDDHALNELARRLAAAANGRDVWCIFDNTARGAATKNALTLGKLLKEESLSGLRR
jgi:uncharacterized protein YecE (DUF72 family)